MKNKKVGNFRHWPAPAGRAGRSKKGLSPFITHPLLFLAQYLPPFHPNQMENTKLKFFAIHRFWLVGLVGQKIVSATSNIWLLFRGLQMNSVQKETNYKMRSTSNLQHPHLQPKPLGRLGSFLGWEYIRGIEVASPWRFWNFYLEPQKIGPLGGQGLHPRRVRKLRKIYFLFF